MGILYVVATPIGNLEDITIRAIKTLLSVPVVACEDTRHTGQLIKILKERYYQMAEIGNLMTNTRYISVRDWNEQRSIDDMLVALAESDVALVSDAGTPLLSDPGFKLVRAVREAGYVVSPIPGAFAGAAALSAAGLPTNKFLFWGFLPKKWDLEPRITHIIYESPVRTHKTLQLISSRYPDAQIVIARELTKIHEQFVPYDEEFKKQRVKGEVTLLVYLPGGKQITTGHGNGDGNLEQTEDGGSDVG